MKIGKRIMPSFQAFQRRLAPEKSVPVLFDSEWYAAHSGRHQDIGAAVFDYRSQGWRKGLSPHPLFDVAWYLDKNQDVKQAGMEPLHHYVLYGCHEGRWPNPLFDPALYLAVNPDVAALGIEPLAHYASQGWREGRQPHPFFDIDYYKQQLAADEQEGDPLAHYLHKGWRKGKSTTRLFSPTFYSKEAALDATGDVHPLAHYIHVGAYEGKSPHPLFNAAYYQASNPDIEKTGYQGFLHYIQHGWREGRKPNPFFFPGWYRAVHNTEGLEPLAHYIARGYSIGLNPCPYFDGRWYSEYYSDVEGEPLAHFVNFGARQLRNPNPYFDSRWYAAQYLLGAEKPLPLAHFIEIGQAQNYSPGPSFNTLWYRKKYPKHLQTTHCEPLEHYLTAGRHIGLSASEYAVVARYAGEINEDAASSSKPDSFAEGIDAFIRYTFGRRPLIVFIASADPISADPRDGYVQRIRSIDSSFVTWTRIYLSPVMRGAGEEIVTKLAPNVFILRLNDDRRDIQLARRICEQAHAVYAHSIFPLREKLFLKLFKAGHSRIVDLHGVIPEEMELQGNITGACDMHRLERRVMIAATDIVCVTDRMRRWIRMKYPLIPESVFVTVPITLPKTILNSVVAERAHREPKAIYAGGLQKWQCIEMMFTTIQESRLETLVVTHDPGGAGALLDRHPVELREMVAIATAQDPSQLWALYASADFGFALRARSIVNEVACPTKLIEYCAAGVIPVLHFEDIGDFRELGLQFLRADDLISGSIPNKELRYEMMMINLGVFFKVSKRYEIGLREILSKISQRREIEYSPSLLHSANLGRSLDMTWGAERQRH